MREIERRHIEEEKEKYRGRAIDCKRASEGECTSLADIIFITPFTSLISLGGVTQGR